MTHDWYIWELHRTCTIPYGYPLQNNLPGIIVEVYKKYGVHVTCTSYTGVTLPITNNVVVTYTHVKKSFFV